MGGDGGGRDIGGDGGGGEEEEDVNESPHCWFDVFFFGLLRGIEIGKVGSLCRGSNTYNEESNPVIFTLQFVGFWMVETDGRESDSGSGKLDRG